MNTNTLVKHVAALALLAASAGPLTATAAELGGANNSMSPWGGDGYVYFHEARPGSSKSLPTFRETNPKGLPEANYAAASNEDPEWQAPMTINKATPAADPIPGATTQAQKIARFRAEDRFLQDASTR